jgi:hypothetical protein
MVIDDILQQLADGPTLEAPTESRSMCWRSRFGGSKVEIQAEELHSRLLAGRPGRV